jgi:hypothetical protein
MSVILEKTRNVRKHLPSAPPRIEELPHSHHGRDAAFDHVGKRGLSAKHWVRIWKPNPSIGKLLAIQNIECLKNACEQRDPRFERAFFSS